MYDNQTNSNTVSGEIIKILDKKSKYGNIYFDVHFKLIDTGSFYRSCIYTLCRNYSNWKDFLQVGNILSDLKLITKYGKLFIDADSFPVLIRSGNPNIQSFKTERNERKILQGSLF